MEKNTLWDAMQAQIASVSTGKFVRICLVLLAIIGSVAIALAWSLSSHVATHASQAIPAAATGPVSKTWYFAEGRVGTGYAENFTIGNPASTGTCAADVQYIYQRDSGSAGTKTVTVSIAAMRRVSESVNTDLNITPSQSSGAWVGAVIKVNTSSTPSCTGVVVERSVYFNANSINSGDEIIGSTHLGTTFYFADMPTGTGYTSDIAILNTNTSAAHVT